MAVPFAYSLRNLRTRRLTTALTAAGMGMVVFVFCAVLMLAEGLQATLVETGSPQNVVVIRRAAASEVQSGIDRSQAAVVETDPAVATDPEGERLLAKELVVLITLPKRGSEKPSNVVIRGVGPKSALLRPQVRLVEGRMPRPGTAEIASGVGIARRFRGAGLGETLHFAQRDWLVVGVFEAGGSGFESEVWGDADQLMQAFRRHVFSSLIFRLTDSPEFQPFRERIENDPRLTLEPKRENRYYADQSEVMAKFLRIMGISLTVIFSIGAVIGAMITMYAAVANRTREIGTLRALGFRRGHIMTAFLLESLLLGLIGGVAGIIPASFLQLVTISTMNWQSFSELAFSFTLTPSIAASAIGFSLFMGLAGGLLPAWRGARMKIVDALRSD